MNKKLSVLATASLLVGLSGSLQAAPLLALVPSSTTVAVGDSVTIDLVISGLGGEIVTGYDLNIGYDTGLLAWSEITMYLSPFGGASNVLSGFDSDDSDGKIGGDLTSFATDPELEALQGDSILLMRFAFTGLADGSTYVDFGSDPDFERLVTGRLDQFGIASVLDLDYQGACITVGNGPGCVNRVPEPQSYGLAALALLGAACARRSAQGGRSMTA